MCLALPKCGYRSSLVPCTVRDRNALIPVPDGTLLGVGQFYRLRNHLTSLINETPPSIYVQNNNPFSICRFPPTKVTISNYPQHRGRANYYIWCGCWKMFNENILFQWSTLIDDVYVKPWFKFNTCARPCRYGRINVTRDLHLPYNY